MKKQSKRTMDELLEIFCTVAGKWFGRDLTPMQRSEFTREVVSKMSSEQFETISAATTEEIERTMLDWFQRDAREELAAVARVGKA